MKVLSIINQKGGVGKSTTALAVGAGLTNKGYKVLFIDLDPQGNLSYTLQAYAKGYGVAGILERPETAAEEIQHTEKGDIIASTPTLAGADTFITETGKEYRLKEALDTIANKYDFCIIDTPPALGILTINALTASSGAVIPTQADVYSLQGIAQLAKTIETVKKYCNSDLSILGIVITRFNKRTIIKREIAEVLKEKAKALNTRLYNSYIRECTAIVEAQALRKSIYEYAPKSNGSLDYKALVNEILRKEKAK